MLGIKTNLDYCPPIGGLPKSLIEASATGRLIVTTDASGCREVVVDGENGYLRNAKKLAETITILRRNEELLIWA